MQNHRIFLGKAFGAHVAFERFLARVNANMLVEVVTHAERLAAMVAGERFLASVHPAMLGERAALGEALFAHLAFVRLLLGVDAQMANVVIVVDERLVAVLAHVLDLAGVRLLVQLQRGGVRIRFRAFGAFVRLLDGVVCCCGWLIRFGRDSLKQLVGRDAGKRIWLVVVVAAGQVIPAAFLATVRGG